MDSPNQLSPHPASSEATNLITVDNTTCDQTDKQPNAMSTVSPHTDTAVPALVPALAAPMLALERVQPVKAAPTPTRLHTAVPRLSRTPQPTPRAANLPFLSPPRRATLLPSSAAQIDTTRKTTTTAMPRASMKRALPNDDATPTNTQQRTTQTMAETRPVKRARLSHAPATTLTPTTTPRVSIFAAPAARGSNIPLPSNNAAVRRPSVAAPRSSSVGCGSNVWNRLYSGAQARKERTEERAMALRAEEAAKLGTKKQISKSRKEA